MPRRNVKFRALRLDTGCFAWASESKLFAIGNCNLSKIRLRFYFNTYSPYLQKSLARPVSLTQCSALLAAGNEMVRTKTLCKGAIVAIDAQPYRQCYENHYTLPFLRRKGVEITEEETARCSSR